ncbi:fibronectin type III domain-containing protein [Candidatus Peribacteria bacterium]|nr:fibronectin type III domain-containing protein [Candidatus Peribacteria bacterium]
MQYSAFASRFFFLLVLGLATLGFWQFAHGQALSTPPSVIDDVTISAENGAVTLQWQEATDPDGIVIGYMIYYGPESVTAENGNTYENEVLIPAQSSYTIEGLTNGMPYYFAITPVDDEGNEAETYSPEVSAVPGKINPLELQTAEQQDAMTVVLAFSTPLAETTDLSAVTITDESTGEAITLESVMSEGSTLTVTVSEGSLEPNRRYRVTVQGLSGAAGQQIVQGVKDSLQFRGKSFSPTTPADTSTPTTPTPEDTAPTIEDAVGTGSTMLPDDRDYTVPEPVTPEETPATTPVAPLPLQDVQNLSADTTSYSTTGEVTLHWSPALDASGAVTGYSVSWQAEGQGYNAPTMLEADVNSLVLKGLKNGTFYDVKIVTLGSNGQQSSGAYGSFTTHAPLSNTGGSLVAAYALALSTLGAAYWYRRRQY